jgi:hypothetical protein
VPVPERRQAQSRLSPATDGVSVVRALHILEHRPYCLAATCQTISHATPCRPSMATVSLVAQAPPLRGPRTPVAGVSSSAGRCRVRGHVAGVQRLLGTGLGERRGGRRWGPHRLPLRRFVTSLPHASNANPRPPTSNADDNERWVVGRRALGWIPDTRGPAGRGRGWFAVGKSPRRPQRHRCHHRGAHRRDSTAQYPTRDVDAHRDPSRIVLWSDRPVGPVPCTSTVGPARSEPCRHHDTATVGSRTLHRSMPISRELSL